MSFLGSSKSSSVQQTVNNDNRQQDNKVAADGGSSVITTAGGEYQNNAGAISTGSGSNVTINATAHDSVQLAGDIARGAQNAAAAADAEISQLATGVVGTVASLAQGKDIPSVAGSTTTKWVVLAVVAAVAIGAGAFLFVKVKR